MALKTLNIAGAEGDNVNNNVMCSPNISNLYIRGSLHVNLYHAEFLNGIIHLIFLELPIIIFGISRCKIEVGQPTV